MADNLPEFAADGTGDDAEKERSEGSKLTAFDGEQVQGSRLSVDTWKCLLAKAPPKIFGDRLAIDSKRIAFIMARAKS